MRRSTALPSFVLVVFVLATFLTGHVSAQSAGQAFARITSVNVPSSVGLGQTLTVSINATYSTTRIPIRACLLKSRMVHRVPIHFLRQPLLVPAPIQRDNRLRSALLIQLTRAPMAGHPVQVSSPHLLR